MFGACFVLIDIGCVLGAFLIAHWMRFVVGRDELSALGLDHYLRVALAVASITILLLAVHGLYEAERRPSWPKRFNAIVSALSTALVLTIVAGFVLGDQSYSRIWFGTGWALAILSLIVWRTLVEYVYAPIRAALVPANRVLIVGANPLGQQLATEDRKSVV